MGGLDVLVDEAAPVDLCEGRSDRDGEAQKAQHLHGRPEQSVKRLAAGILEHQHGPTAFADEFERPHRPRPFQLVLQSVFVSKTIEGGRCRMLRGGQHGQRGCPTTVGVALSSTEDEFAVLPQDLEATISTSAEPRGSIHLRDPPPTRWLGSRSYFQRVAREGFKPEVYVVVTIYERGDSRKRANQISGDCRWTATRFGPPVGTA